MAVKTRAQRRSIARSNRRRLKKSKCRGKGPAACRGTAGCKLASGKKRSFCRNNKNRTRRNRNQKGGFLTGVLTAARQALLPVLMYKAQKHQQKRVRSQTQKSKSRSQSKSRR